MTVPVPPFTSVLPPKRDILTNPSKLPSPIRFWLHSLEKEAASHCPCVSQALVPSQREAGVWGSLWAFTLRPMPRGCLTLSFHGAVNLLIGIRAFYWLNFYFCPSNELKEFNEIIFNEKKKAPYHLSNSILFPKSQNLLLMCFNF